MMTFAKGCRLSTLLVLAATSAASATGISTDEVHQAIRSASGMKG